MRAAAHNATRPDWRPAMLAVAEGGLAVFQPATGSLAGRRMARALLEEAAVLGGGQVIGLAGGDVLLGTAAAPGQRAAQAISTLLGSPPDSFALPSAQGAALARCAAAEAGPAVPGFTLAGLEAHCASLPLEAFARVTLFAEGTGTAPVAQRLGPAPLGLEDAELEAMAREWLCRRVLAALTDPGLRRRLPALRPGLRLILDLPQAGLSQTHAAPETRIRGARANDPNSPIALLPLSALASPSGFTRLAGGLRQSGWAVGLLAEDASAMRWVDGTGEALTDVIWASPRAETWAETWAEIGAGGTTARPPIIALGHPVAPGSRRPGILHEGCA
jgi:hypothetical protein